LVDDGKVSHSVASQNIFPILVEHPEKDPLKIAEENNLIQESDSSAIEQIVREVLAKYPDKVAEYHSGKTGLVGLFMGEVMKLSKGKADPKSANKIVQKILEEHA
jgi:aspartyl-tRNA(Asn)/glutamyl-tRNA(Gln) amidotransferase subunit B